MSPGIFAPFWLALSAVTSRSVSQPPRYDQSTPSKASVASCVRLTITRLRTQGGRHQQNRHHHIHTAIEESSVEDDRRACLFWIFFFGRLLAQVAPDEFRNAHAFALRALVELIEVSAGHGEANLRRPIVGIEPRATRCSFHTATTTG